jgi:SAM-dependent methyltransferase
MTQSPDNKAARLGEPSYVWREGQQRRFDMILRYAGERVRGRVLENGCGVGMYLEKLGSQKAQATGLEYEFDRAVKARTRWRAVINAAGESLPFPASTFDLILSHEVIEHVKDDRQAMVEMVRALKPGGRIILFCPNRGYPFETHGIYLFNRYFFGNFPLVNYLPRAWRNKLAPHVRVYSFHDLEKLFAGLSVRFLERTILFGAYDNIIALWGIFGKLLRGVLQPLEKTRLRALGLSHFWVVEKTS